MVMVLVLVVMRKRKKKEKDEVSLDDQLKMINPGGSSGLYDSGFY